MQSVTVARDFCERAGLPALAAGVLPHWFFLEDGNQENQQAIELAEVYDQACDLKSLYWDQLVSRVKDEYPILYVYVMSGHKDGSSVI